MSGETRGIYLDLLPWREALSRLLSALEWTDEYREDGPEKIAGDRLDRSRDRRLKREEPKKAVCGSKEWENSTVQNRSELVPTSRAVGRILDRPAYASLSSPHYNAAAMDGIAVRCEDTYTASETTPVTLKLRQASSQNEEVPKSEIHSFQPAREPYKGTYVWVDTGDFIPDGYDAVIMIEDINPTGDDGTSVEVIRPAHPWQHVRLIGEDIVEGEMILPGGHTVTPTDVAALLAGGLTAIRVRRRPVIGIIPTGTELVSPKPDLAPGEIPEFNSSALSALIEEWGGVATVYPPVPDDFDEICRAVNETFESGADMVVVNAGSSAGSEDYTPRVIASLGELLVKGAAIRPGKPILLGVYKDKRPLLGLPGYPVSMVLTADLFLKPLIYKFLGKMVPERPREKAYLATRIVSSLGVEEFVRVRMGLVGDRRIATPLGRGAGVTTSLLKSDGVLVVPALTEGLKEGTLVDVELWRPLRDIDRNAVIIGSHDLTLDILHDILSRSTDPIGISSAHVGSLGGIVAVSKGYAHAAGVHLLDEASGVYNIPYVKKYMPGKKICLFRLVGRVQGIMVAPGNPKGIVDIEDLARADVVIINRQRGAGTRILLDHYLKHLGILPESVKGYEREEHTHMAVAAAVKGGSADAGLGILAAARALGLDFLPLTIESYDLLIPEEYFDEKRMVRVMETAQSSQFKKAVEKLGGYDLSGTGKLHWVLPELERSGEEVQ